MEGRSKRVLVCALLCLGLAACGENTVDEPILGEQRDRDVVKAESNERRIAELERRRAALRAVERRQRAAAAGDAQAPSGDELAGFEAFVSTLGASVGIAVGPPGRGPDTTAGTLASGSAWSTIKVPLAAAVIADRGGPARISPAERALIERAITASDNAAAAQLWASLSQRHGGAVGAASAVGEILHSAGDSSTVVSTEGRDGFSPYGQTEWSLETQEQFMAALAGGCLPASGDSYLLDTMGRVISSQAWGLGSAGVGARFKGGWGPGTDGRYLVRQMGVLDLPDGGQLVVAIAAVPNDGSLAAGTAILDQVAAWLVEHGTAMAGPAGSC